MESDSIASTANPYSAPQASGVAAEPHRAQFVLASRWQRFGGAFIDGLVAWLLGGLPARLLAGVGVDPGDAPATLWFGVATPSPLLQTLCGLVPLAIQYALVGRRGQTIGKFALGTRIVRADGSTASWSDGVLLRTLPLTVLHLAAASVQIAFGPTSFESIGASVLVGALVLVDDLVIFGDGYRCVHDYIANTWVVRIDSQSGAP